MAADEGKVRSLAARRRIFALLLAITYLVFAVFWQLGVGLVSVVVTVVIPALAAGEPLPMDTASMLEAQRADITALTYFVGLFVPVVVGAVAAWWWLGQEPRRAHALGTPPALPIGLGLVCGLFVGLFPGWISEQIITAFPSLDQGALALIARLLLEGPLHGRILMVLTVCVAAPLLEELLFRGLLWHLLEQVFPTWVVWLVTSLVFALFHLDPVQSPALIFTSLVIGWVRWQSRSLWPGIAVHFVNNTLATVLVMLLAADVDVGSGLLWALPAAALTLVLCVAAWFVRTPQLSTATSP